MENLLAKINWDNFIKAQKDPTGKKINFDDILGSDEILGSKTQKIKKQEILNFCDVPQSEGLKITVNLQLSGNEIITNPADITITPSALLPNSSLLKNEFAISKEILLSNEWFNNSINTLLKISVCKNKKNPIYIIVVLSNDGTGGDGVKVKIPLPE